MNIIGIKLHKLSAFKNILFSHSNTVPQEM